MATQPRKPERQMTINNKEATNYKCTISYAAPNGLMRAASIIVQAEDSNEAQDKAEATAEKQGWQHVRVTKIVKY